MTNHGVHFAWIVGWLFWNWDKVLNKAFSDENCFCTSHRPSKLFYTLFQGPRCLPEGGVSRSDNLIKTTWTYYNNTIIKGSRVPIQIRRPQREWKLLHVWSCGDFSPRDGRFVSSNANVIIFQGGKNVNKLYFRCLETCVHWS